MTLLMLLLLHADSIAGAAGVPTLAPPTNVSIVSVNMRHTLRWRPLREACSTAVLYSVQFQGEFERLVLNSSWVDVHECQVTARTQCDLTFDLGSDSDYNLRVQGRCGLLRSAWTQLDSQFNRRQTHLIPPEVTTSTVGDFLILKFNQLPLTGNVIVTMWRHGEDQQSTLLPRRSSRVQILGVGDVSSGQGEEVVTRQHSEDPVPRAEVFTVPVEQNLLHVQLKDQKVHCFQVRIVVDDQLQSNNSETQCVSIRGPDSVWKVLMVVIVSALVLAAFLAIILWSVVHYRTGSCSWYFHKVALPQSLRSNWDIRPPEVLEEVELHISLVTRYDLDDT